MANQARNETELVFSRYVHSVQTGEGEYALFSGLSGALVKTDRPLQHLQKQLGRSQLSAIDKELKTQLQKGLFLIPDTLNELDYLEQRYQWARHITATLGATIIPTFRCNARCVYCIQDAKRCETMSGELQKTLIESLKRHAQGYPHVIALQIAWYGGEPLLALDNILDIGRQLKSFGESEQLEYNSFIITNGTMLDEETVGQLVETGVTGCQITLDGPKHIHDKRRPLLEPPKSSFEKSIDGIISALGKLTVNIRVNLDPSNVGCVEELWDELEAHNLLSHIQSGEIGISMANVSNFAGLGCRQPCSNVYSLERFSTVELDALRKLFERGIDSYWYPRPELVHCGAITIDSLVVDPLGNLYKCYLDAGHAERSFGKVGEPINFTSEQLLRWITYNPFKIKACRECRYVPICCGGCPALSMVTRDRKAEVCKQWRFTLGEYLQHFVHKATVQS